MQWLVTGASGFVVGLVAWTALAGAWWLIAGRLVRQQHAPAPPTDPPPNPSSGGEPAPSSPPGRGQGWVSVPTVLTLFKALPRGAGREIAAALGSFVSQLDDRSELLVGVETEDGPAWEKVFAQWKQDYPAAKINVLCQPRPATFPNPRASWQRALAARAQGDLWLWSDVDIVAPPGFLTALRQEHAANGATLISCPYVVRRVDVAPMLAEALFVNVEFLPGVLACRRWGKPSFAFGSALLFDPADFHQRVGWEAIGKRLADDNFMGRNLAPVKISQVHVETLAAETRWRDALLHYLRWQKTVRWCRPGGYAALLAITPVVGWLAAVVWRPEAWWTWLGLLATMQMETIAAWRLCALAGCRLRGRHLAVIEAWTLGRALTWLVCWLPWPVVFRSQGKVWWSLYRCNGGKP